ncbi:MAG TPA: hypothetical protein VLB27_00515 [candidate division Zixibacteria bacterium]|nr:hypothetical protein [candidate division Zixibacteria bacterium]
MTQRKRLDIILVEHGILTEEQVHRVLQRQTEEGGKFGAHALALGFVTEKQLVRALSEHFDCPGVALSGRTISTKALELVSGRFAVSRKLIPFDYSRLKKRVSIAVADPTQPRLRDELEYLLDGVSYDLFVAAESAIISSIDRHYERSSLEFSEESAPSSDDSEEAVEAPDEDDAAQLASKRGNYLRVVIVTDDALGGERLKTLIQRTGPEVEVVASLDGAIDCLHRHFIDTVFVQESLAADRRTTEDSVRAFNFRTEVRWFRDCSSLALGATSSSFAHSLKTAELLVSLLGAADGRADNRPQALARFADRICRRLRLPLADAERIITAALLHNLHRFDGAVHQERISRARLFARSADLLESIGFDSDLVATLRATHRDRHREICDENPAPTTVIGLGGDILALADQYCEERSPDEPLSLALFEDIRTRYSDFDTSPYQPEVIDAFLTSLQEECLNEELLEPRGEVALLNTGPATGLALLCYQLQAQGIRVINAAGEEDLARICARRRPDAITIYAPDREADLVEYITGLKDLGVDLALSPAIVLASEAEPRLSDALFDVGVQDVVSVASSHEILSAKLRTLVERGRRTRQP